MRIRSAGLIASRVLAIYIGFTAIIFSGELVHAVIEGRGAGVVAESALPSGVAIALALVLWLRAGAVADRLARGAEREPGDGTRTVRPSDIAAIAFTVAGIYIAAQALPLIAHAATRLLVESDGRRDIVADAVSATVRTGLGVAIATVASPLARRLFPPDSAG